MIARGSIPVISCFLLALGGCDTGTNSGGFLVGEGGVPEGGLSESGTGATASLDAGPPPPPAIGDTCATDAECEAATQLCATLPNSMGYCSSRCSTDTDCAPMNGVTAACDTNFGVCRMDCIGSGSGDGECPPSMTCITVPLLPSGNGYGCQYPTTGPIPVEPDAGPPPPPDPGELYASCSADNECASQSCIELSGAHMCSEVCTTNDDCSASPGASALPYCADLPGFNACALACPAGAACPDGMNCTDGTCVPTGGLYGACSSDGDCGGDTFCAPSGFCTNPCSSDSECSPASQGTAAPVCYSNERCALDCSGGDCPSGMTCGVGDYCRF